MSEPAKQPRTPEQRYNAWIAWRKKGTATFGDVCGCKIGIAQREEFEPTKCCVPCTGCNQRIKKMKVAAHAKKCTAFIVRERLLADIKPGDEFVELPKDDGVVLGLPYVRCHFCGHAVMDRLEEWHWRNNCERIKQDEEEKYIAGILAAERAGDGGDGSDRPAQAVAPKRRGPHEGDDGGEQRRHRDRKSAERRFWAEGGPASVAQQQGSDHTGE